MRTFLVLTMMFLIPQAKTETARDYYNELYKAGGLDRFADEYVCFDDDPALENFFIFSESKVLRDFVIANGGLSRLPKGVQDRLKKDSLIVRGYEKGIPFSFQDFYDKDGETWVNQKSKLDNVHPDEYRLRLTMSWQTLRYRRSMELFDANGVLRKEVPRFGRCETIPPAVQQRAE